MKIWTWIELSIFAVAGVLNSTIALTETIIHGKTASAAWHLAMAAIMLMATQTIKARLDKKAT